MHIETETRYLRLPSFVNGYTREKGNEIDGYEPAEDDPCRDPESDPEAADSAKDSSIEEQKGGFDERETGVIHEAADDENQLYGGFACRGLTAVFAKPEGHPMDRASTDCKDKRLSMSYVRSCISDRAVLTMGIQELLVRSNRPTSIQPCRRWPWPRTEEPQPAYITQS